MLNGSIPWRDGPNFHPVHHLPTDGNSDIEIRYSSSSQNLVGSTKVFLQRKRRHSSIHSCSRKTCIAAENTYNTVSADVTPHHPTSHHTLKNRPTRLHVQGNETHEGTTHSNRANVRITWSSISVRNDWQTALPKAKFCETK